MAVQLQPLAAVGSPITPLVADPPVPTFTSNAAVPFCCTMLGEVPKPEEMVGAVAEKRRLPDDNPSRAVQENGSPLVAITLIFVPPPQNPTWA